MAQKFVLTTMRIKVAFICIMYVYISFFGSCSKKNEASILLQKARKLAENNPDRALQLIDSITSPGNNLNREQYMQYLVAHTQIYYKNYLPIDDDSLIFKAVKYYQKNQTDPKESALAYFYAGTLLKTQKKYDLTMEYYKNAETHAKKSQDSLTQGLINFNMADLLAEQGCYEKALFKYILAAENYKDYPEKRAYSYSSIGRMYLFMKNLDSAVHYFDKGFEITENLKNIKLKRQLSESLAVAFEQVKNYTESQKYLQLSLSLNTDSTKLPRYHLNFAILYNKMQNDDLTTYYAQKLKQDIPFIEDRYLKASILHFLIDYENKQKHISTAFDYQTDRMNILIQLMKEREKQSIYKIEKRYNYQQIEKQYFESLSKKQQWIILLMGIIILGGISFLIYRTKQKNRHAAIQGKMHTLTEMNRELVSNIQEKQLNLRRELLWRFDITKKFLKVNEEINKKGKNTSESTLLLKQFNRIVYGQSSLEEQWEVLHEAFKQTRPEYSEKIRQIYPEITESEFRICVLTYADFSVKEIALILQQSPNTIQTRRTSLRKKLGLPNGGDIAVFIDRLFN